MSGRGARLARARYAATSSAVRLEVRFSMWDLLLPAPVYAGPRRFRHGGHIRRRLHSQPTTPVKEGAHDRPQGDARRYARVALADGGLRRMAPREPAGAPPREQGA